MLVLTEPIGNRLAVRAEHRSERRGLDGVADGRARAVRFDVLNRRWLEPRVGEAGAEHLFLRDGRRHGHPADAARPG